MTPASLLRDRARRYRELACRHQGATADGMRVAADHLERQADALDAYAAAARLTVPHRLATSV
jgi:hypothetical protein